MCRPSVCVHVGTLLFNSAIDAITRLTNYTVLHKMRIVKRFNFHHTKVRVQLLMSFLLHKKLFLKSKMHAMEETMLPVQCDQYDKL